MTPAFSDSDLIVYYRLAADFQTGDCVVYAGEGNTLLIGRVIAKEGDTVDITSDGLMVNGYYTTEKYANGDIVLFEGGAEFPMTLSYGEYFVLADNRSEGSDSRNYGALSNGIIKGRVLLSLRWRNF